MWRGGLRFASVGDGGPSVVMGGLRQSPLSSVMTSDMRPLVRLLANNQVLWAKIKILPTFLYTHYADKDYSLRPAPNSMPVLLKGVRCTGKELSLLECGYRRAPIVLNHVKDVAVRCKCKL